MKKHLGYILLTLLMSHQIKLSAQNQRMDRKEHRMNENIDSICGKRAKERNDQMKPYKIGHFTSIIEFTAEEAQIFWVIYNEFSDKRDQLHCERKNILRKVRKDKFDPKMAKDLVDKIVKNEENMMQLHKEYNAKFANILSPLKLLRYYAAEESFKMELLNNLRKMKPGTFAPFNKSME
ncbi:MAG: hypothetical protein ACRCSB_03895 [Bacteroidales bacterium]